MLAQEIQMAVNQLALPSCRQAIQEILKSSQVTDMDSLRALIHESYTMEPLVADDASADELIGHIIAVEESNRFH